MEFVSRFQALVRNVAVALDNPGKDKERSKCPRCKGSGLLAQRMPWEWNRKNLSNDPCWFCEGIGVMPVAGLSGFLLGRASSSFNTRDIKPSSQLPIKVQLYLGKYPGTRPKFETRKLCDDPKTLLHDFSKVPDWLSGEDHQQLETPAARKNSVGDGGGGRRVDRSPRTLTPVSSSRRGSSSFFRTKTSRSDESVVPRFSRQLGINSSTPVSKTRSPSSSPKERQQQDPISVPVPVSSSANAAKDSQPDPPAAAPTYVRLARRSPKHFKTPRRERNRIREEAEKMALERARRKQVMPVAVEIDKPEQHQAGAPSPGIRSLGSLSEPSSNWAWASKLPLPPWLEPLKRPSFGNHSWVNQMVYGSLKDRTAPLSPMPGSVPSLRLSQEPIRHVHSRASGSNGIRE